MLNKPINILLIYSLPFTLAILLSVKGEKAILWAVESMLLLHLIGCLLAIGIYLRGEKSKIKKVPLFFQNNRGGIFMALVVVIGCISIVAIDLLLNNKDTVCHPVTTLLLNIVGAFAALYLTYWLLKPKFEIDSTIVQTLDNKLWVCVHNRSRITKLYNLKLEISYYLYREQFMDYDYKNIDIEADNIITMLYSKSQIEKIKQKDSFYVFHSRYAFLPSDRYTGIRCRISATNVISNIVDIKDEYIPFINEKGENNIKWGEFIGDQFMSLNQLYPQEEHDRIHKIIEFNNIISKILVKANNRQKVNKQNWEEANKIMAEFQNDYIRIFPNLIKMQTTIDEFYKKLNLLYLLITDKEIMTPANRDTQQKLLIYLTRSFEDISKYMSCQLKQNKL